MKLENERYVVTFCEAGGEIASFTDKETGIQYMWQGDEAYWTGKNPGLFPLVGNTYSGDYEIDGKRYAMKNHGLIRYATLAVAQDDGEHVVMSLDSDDATLAQYPFPFHYEVDYQLEGNKLIIVYRITNTGDKEMPFTFGLHPGFNCPLTKDEQFEDYKIVFSNPEKMKQILFDPKKETPYKTVDVALQEIPCDYALIKQHATLVYEGAKSAYVTLQGKEHGVHVSMIGYPYVAFWTAKEGAPFICLEPWYGHGDFSEVAEDFYHREGTMILSPKKTFTTSYTIEVF